MDGIGERTDERGFLLEWCEEESVQRMAERCLRRVKKMGNLREGESV